MNPAEFFDLALAPYPDNLEGGYVVTVTIPQGSLFVEEIGFDGIPEFRFTGKRSRARIFTKPFAEKVKVAIHQPGAKVERYYTTISD